MNDLETQLGAMRREYEAVRYPGDLVADVRRRQTNVASRRTFAFIGAAAAFAACAVIVIVLQMREQRAGRSANTFAMAPDVAPLNPIVDGSESMTTVSLAGLSPPSWSDVYSDTSTAAAKSITTMASDGAVVPPGWSIVPSEVTLSAVETETGTETEDQKSEDTR